MGEKDNYLVHVSKRSKMKIYILIKEYMVEMH